MAKSRTAGRLTNPVVAAKMYEVLCHISEAQGDDDLEDALGLVASTLAFIRDGSLEGDDSKMAKQSEKAAPSEWPKRYSVRLGVKIPSRVENYRNLEANVTVTANDPEEALSDAREQFAKAVMLVCNTMGEAPPDEIRPTLEELYETNDVAAMYGEA